MKKAEIPQIYYEEQNENDLATGHRQQNLDTLYISPNFSLYTTKIFQNPYH